MLSQQKKNPLIFPSNNANSQFQHLRLLSFSLCLPCDFLFQQRGEKFAIKRQIIVITKIFCVTVCVWNLSLTWSVLCQQQFAIPSSWHRLEYRLREVLKAFADGNCRERSRKMLKSISLATLDDFSLPDWSLEKALDKHSGESLNTFNN